MKPISAHKHWGAMHWLRLRLEQQGRDKEFLEKIDCEFENKNSKQILEVGRREFGFTTWRTERMMVEGIIAAKQFIEEDAKVAPAEVALAEEEAKQKEYDKLAAPIDTPAAPAPTAESGDVDFVKNVAWVMENMRTYVRRDPGKPVRIINIGRLKKSAPSESAITLLLWSADNLNKFMELSFRVLPKKQEKEVTIDEKHFEDDDDVESLRKAIAESQL